MKKFYFLFSVILVLSLSVCQCQVDKTKQNSNNKTDSELISYQYLISKDKIFDTTIETYKIRYQSDGLELTGYMLKPESVEKELPVIIFNRGGNKDFGSINHKTLNYLATLSADGYLVLASQYRGNMFSEGKDEFGGKDINDVLQLINISKSLPFADSENIGVLGYSRGGLMAYLISRKVDDIKAIAVVGAPTDLFLGIKNRPEMYEKVYLPLIGDTTSMRSAYIDRSPYYWANEINEPVLILHGTSDWRVNIEHANKITRILEQSERTSVEYKFFEGGDHSLRNFQDERNELIQSWFEKHLKTE